MPWVSCWSRCGTTAPCPWPCRSARLALRGALPCVVLLRSCCPTARQGPSCRARPACRSRRRPWPVPSARTSFALVRACCTYPFVRDCAVCTYPFAWVRALHVPVRAARQRLRRVVPCPLDQPPGQFLERPCREHTGAGHRVHGLTVGELEHLGLHVVDVANHRYPPLLAAVRRPLPCAGEQAPDVSVVIPLPGQPGTRPTVRSSLLLYGAGGTGLFSHVGASGLGLAGLAVRAGLARLHTARLGELAVQAGGLVLGRVGGLGASGGSASSARDGPPVPGGTTRRSPAAPASGAR